MQVGEPSFKLTNLQKWRFIASANCDHRKSCSLIRKVFNKVDSVHRRPFIYNKDLCGYCDIYENKGILRSFMLTLNAGWNDVEQKAVTTKKVRGDNIALLCIRGDSRDTYPDGDDREGTSFYGTI